MLGSMTPPSGRRSSLGIALRWGLGGVLAWLLLAVGGSLLLGPGGHPPASAFLLPALAVPSILFRVGAGLGLPWLADASILTAAPVEWGVLGAALGLSIRGRGTGRRLGLGALACYLLTFLAPPLLLQTPTAARRAAVLEGSWVRGPALENPDSVSWQELGESDPETASKAEIEACLERWSRWLEDRRSEGSNPEGSNPAA